MDKMERNIMVVPVNVLFSEYERKTGFYDKSYDFKTIIENNFEYMKRKFAEYDENYKQPLPYALLQSPDGKFFMYQRWGKNSQVGESRLYDKVSFWVGWHIEEDVKDSKTPLEESLLREIEEETWLSRKDIQDIKLVWYINDDTNEVWKVHFWVAYIVKLKTDKFKIDEWELAYWEFLHKNDIIKLINNPKVDIEPWSKIILENLVL